ncbi:MAG TPA: SHOCT domain-containing protein [Geminicoccaceae bacterium]|nr:SHOCT domain-containing protein [Geminicoccus sp.]HMU48461.1 SHOCT domain-containing protein [Geminicoccaceae bacterium]
MEELTAAGREAVADLQQRYGVSEDAVMTLLRAVAAGGGGMAQFSHPELGGMGQWSQGGMTMVGDMFNNALKARVDGLCTELSRRLSEAPLLAAPAAAAAGGGGTMAMGRAWWPDGLGVPAATGGQNDMRYAWFPQMRRLAVQVGGDTRVYDTGEHLIGGFGQQQGSDQSITMTSQLGTVRLADLPQVSGGAPAAPAMGQQASQPAAVEQAMAQAASAGGDVIAQIERLGQLRDRGVLSPEEFASAKAELLKRL